MKKIFPILFVGLCVFIGCEQPRTTIDPSAVSGSASIAQAFQTRTSDLLVDSGGTVVKVLSDDREAPRHQRFILRLGNGHTLLMAHNIDLAPRVVDLKKGDHVHFRGEYEWNPQGGVIHWTHHDPEGRRPGGWIDHDGVRYE